MPASPLTDVFRRSGPERPLAVLLAIFAMALAVAVVTFGLLDSTASGDLQGYSVGGAIAGFLVTASTLTSIYSLLVRSSGELKELRERNHELEQKLVRGVPRPLRFDVEVDERRRLVLARPQHWRRRGGTLFEFVQGYPQSEDASALPVDCFPATVYVRYLPLTDARHSEEAYYRHVRESAAQAAAAGWLREPSFEYVFLGSEPPLMALRVCYTQLVLSHWERDPLTGELQHSFSRVHPDQATEQAPAAVGAAAALAGGDGLDGARTSPAVASPAPPAAAESATQAVVTRHIDVHCYNESLESIFLFEFIDNEDDFADVSAEFNQLLRSVRFLG